jgi:hypothetical protein
MGDVRGLCNFLKSYLASLYTNLCLTIKLVDLNPELTAMSPKFEYFLELQLPKVMSVSGSSPFNLCLVSYNIHQYAAC